MILELAFIIHVGRLNGNDIVLLVEGLVAVFAHTRFLIVAGIDDVVDIAVFVMDNFIIWRETPLAVDDKLVVVNPRF